MKKYIVVFVIVFIIVLTVGLVSSKKQTSQNVNKEETKKEENNLANDPVTAKFYDLKGNTLEVTFSREGATFTTSKWGKMTLGQAVSASGARYANPDESIVLWNKGNEVSLYEKDSLIFSGTTNKPDIGTTNNESLDGKTKIDLSKIQSINWIWQKSVLGENIISPKKVGVFTLLMKKDGNISGKTDCNGFFGEYKISTDGSISVGSLASTMMYCEGSQERVYVDKLGNINKYSLDASGNLILSLPLNEGYMVFKKQ